MQNQDSYVKKVKLFTMLATAFIFVLAVIGVFQIITARSLERKIAQREEQIAELSVKSNDLSSGIKNHSSSIYREQYAREELGMLDDDEVYFSF